MSNEIQFILYHLPDEEGKVQVVIKDETIWATQKAMAQLFGVDKSGISRHIANIFKDGELRQETTVAKIATVVNRGIRGTVEEPVDFYNLDMIIAVGYRVSSARATKFRIWATKILNEYIRKGFVLDDERLKQGKAVFGKDYFRELLERVRSIRASERRIWQQITDIYAECSFDYDRNSPTTREFYQMVQNKEHMGLQTWKNAPDGRVLLSDTKVAKNYLPEKEIKQLERAVTGYFDYIEDLIERENAFNMEQFAASVNEFLTFRRYALLPDKGKISREEADRKAEEEYKLFNPKQKIDSDFDKEIRGLFDNNN